jgi:hypothetical protein
VGPQKVLTRYLLADFGAKLAPNDAGNLKTNGAFTSAQIARVRAAAAGAVNLPVDRAVVTYVKPSGLGSGNDGVGFFVQAEQAGPALMVNVDPEGAVAAGDVVSFTVTSVAKVTGIVQAGAISGLAKVGTYDLAALVQDVNDVDLVTGLDDYDSELITGTFAVAGSFGSSGSGFVAANVTTAGVPTSTSSFRLRMPTALQTAVDLVPGCQITLGKTPLFRYNATSEPSAWVASDFTATGCPPRRWSARRPRARPRSW